MYKKALTVLGTLGAISSAQALQFGNLSVAAYVAPYFTYIDYNNSGVKKNGWATTLYGSFSINKGTYIWEWAYGYTHLNYKNSPSGWNQNDYVLKYSNYQFFPWYGKLGIHYITGPSNADTQTGTVFFAEVGYIQRYYWNAGAEYAYSSYRNGVHVNQVRLNAGRYKWFTMYSGLYFEGDLYGINVNKKQQLGLPKKNYISAALAVTYFKPKYSIKARTWIGDRVFAVANGGFVVYNLTEKYKDSLSIQGTYYINRQLNIGLEISFAQYKEIDTNKTVDTYIFTGNLGYSF